MICQAQRKSRCQVLGLVGENVKIMFHNKIIGGAKIRYFSFIRILSLKSYFKLNQN